MTADNENTIREIISKAQPVQDPLKELVQKTESDPGAPFEPEMIQLIAELRQNDLAEFFRLRSKLKRRGVSLRALDAAISGQGGVGDGVGTVGQRDALVRFAEEADLFHTPDGKPYADVLVKGARRTLEITDQGGFGDWLQERWFEETDRAPCPEAFRAAVRTIAARARYAGAEHEVYVRVAAHEGSYYLDLANDNGDVVQIDQQEWDVIRCSPVRFFRPSGMLPLPMPERGGSLTKDLFPLLNLKSEFEQVLVTLWLVNSLIASSNYRVLVLRGEHGTAKTRTTCTLRDLLDPQAGKLRPPPHNDRDLAVSAVRHHVLAFDNISTLSQEMSDTFCRISTGTSFAVRKLYTDREEELFTAVKPIIVNGIEDFVTREDLADRAFCITLQPIPSDVRRTDAELDRAFEQRRAYILGALLDMAVHGLKRITVLDSKPISRMADFDRMAVASETYLWPAGTYERAFNENRGELIDIGIEGDLLATAVLRMVSDNAMRAMRAMRAVDGVMSVDVWRGTATDLLREVNDRNPTVLRNREWPKNARHLASRLRRVAPLLRHKGVEIDFRGVEGHSNTRLIYITANPSPFREHVAPLAPLADGSQHVDAPVSQEQDVVDQEGNVIETPPPQSEAPGANTPDALISNAPKRYVVIKKPQKKVAETQVPDRKTVDVDPAT
jgi:hypothetical protein